MSEEDICCPPLDTKRWDQQEHTWQDKPFIKDEVRQIFHIPLNMGPVITRMWQKVEAAKAKPDDLVMLAYDPSPWKCELYLSTAHEVPGAENVTISGTFLSKVYDGPFQQCGAFYKDMLGYVTEKGKEAKKVYFYYAYCPKCAKKYGHNYIVAFAQV